MEVNFLPITIAKENDQVQRFRENASFGLGRLEALVATGIKQKHLSDRSRLEQELDLDKLLQPLKSSHTQNDTGDHEDDSGRNNDKPADDPETEEENDRGEDNAN